MVRTTDADATDATPEEYAAAYANDPTPTHFGNVTEAVRREYHDRDVTHVEDTVLTPTGLAAKLCADALGYDTSDMIDFDGDDDVTVDFDPFDQDDPHATPIDLVRLAAHADDICANDVVFRDGAGSVTIRVESPHRRDD